MNLPNKLTVMRIIMVPLFLVFLLVNAIPYNYFWALLIFAAASLTDMIDGKLARKHNLVTNFGKFADPIADKLLVCAALICMIPLKCIPAVAVFIIVGRDTAIDGLRSVAASSGKVIAANIFGKIKTALQMVAVVVTLFLLGMSSIRPGLLPRALVVTNIMWWVIACYTMVTLVIYFVQNSDCIDPKQ